ncbi:MAG: protein kinase [Gemmatimonadetes bacterium]|nr:protein kinase [Gemmatimonadota bacterium]
MNPIPSAELSLALASALGPQYRLERELGRGGMGVVYLATDLTLHRTVAVMAIMPELALNASRRPPSRASWRTSRPHSTPPPRVA